MDEMTIRSDSDLEAAVVDELDWNPEVDTTHVRVSVDRGTVTLLGEVASFHQRLAAAATAVRVNGVRAVAQEIVVAGAGDLPSDSAVAHQAQEALDRAVDVPDTVRVVVQDRVLVLSGEVPWQFERSAAERSVRYLAGVLSVVNLITLRPHAQPADIRNRIGAALARSATIDASAVTVVVEAGVVTLSGQVRSLVEQHDVEALSWSAPGVVEVHDRLRIVP